MPFGAAQLVVLLVQSQGSVVRVASAKALNGPTKDHKAITSFVVVQHCPTNLKLWQIQKSTIRFANYGSFSTCNPSIRYSFPTYSFYLILREIYTFLKMLKRHLGWTIKNNHLKDLLLYNIVLFSQMVIISSAKIEKEMATKHLWFLLHNPLTRFVWFVGST